VTAVSALDGPERFREDEVPYFCIVIRSLAMGGAERLAASMAATLRAMSHSCTFLVFYGGGTVEADLRADGFEVVDLGKRGRWDLIRPWLRMIKYLRLARPRFIYAMLPPANLFVVCAKPWLIHSSVVLSYHSSRTNFRTLSPASRLSHEINVRIARYADNVIANSALSSARLFKFGTQEKRTRVIPNGFDAELYQFDPVGREQVRAGWGVGEDCVVFGLVASRFEQVKGHRLFLEAAAITRKALSTARFVCLGAGDEQTEGELRQLAGRLQIGDDVVWAGTRPDMVAVYSAIDVVVCASIAEGGPNVVGEAMACGTPCVSTDVGSARRMIGDTGEVVDSRTPGDLARAMLKVAGDLDEDGAQVARRARERIVSEFSIRRYVEEVTSFVESSRRAEELTAREQGRASRRRRLLQSGVRPRSGG